MANGGYNIAKKKLIDGALNLGTADLRLLLVGTGYTFDPDHAFVAAVVANELSGTGYTRVTLAGKATAQDDTNNRAEMDCNDVEYAAINAGTAKAALVFVQVTNDSDSFLVGYFDEGGFPFVTNGGPLTLQVNAEGLFWVA
jgi:hypothetical protein